MSTPNNSLQMIAYSIQNLLTLKDDNQKIHFDRLKLQVDIVANELRLGSIRQSELDIIHNTFTDEFLNDSLVGHIIRKPYGYNEDFRITDAIHDNFLSDDYPNWDRLIHASSIAKSIKSRKEYFKNYLTHKLNKSTTPKKMLMIAPGSGRSLLELYKRVNPNLKTDCLDLNKNSIHYYRGLTQEFSNQINYINESIHSFNVTEKYDMVWIEGVFEYMDDVTFVNTLKQIQTYINNDGDIVISNISKKNTSKNIMEILFNWQCTYRNRLELNNLAIKSNLKPSQINIRKDAIGINSFLHIK
ncbi:class I SAM-dependent methyltransferase [Flammeovirga kamogawensis]|uniref:Class I SAM-dependent methyltransferase n=1 Tax=Flammeovirga kamogawensis TaxID=373891 RepID=A0ABX8GVA2_9BACT|nr:class I SAM-dependent methyltransferase [Flammeovirga kamogawensis]MBB6459597.1 2-polyprenyl-3-methyl-5-hydroxy-6-metoxy-1,4-benzoquinol methylase [Flammeovirga kamogawensis]QWG07339.1 class I SAM-dependent methyltransferase [Flammeovirga kamogawensis]TRX69156.1 class I SAM-dependent methyltransferase [Flammeovirga kamogawensis]